LSPGRPVKLLNERSSVSKTGERARLAGTEPLSFAKLISKCFSDVRLLKRTAIAKMHFNEQREVIRGLLFRSCGCCTALECATNNSVYKASL